MMEGYLHPLYAQSFSEIGEPLYLPKSKGWLIKRIIPNTPYYDAMGPYPLFFCESWDDLIFDLTSQKDNLVSVSLVVPPLSQISTEHFTEYFTKFLPYKDHYILDLSLPIDQAFSKARRKDARRAHRYTSVELVTAPNIDVDEWSNLYNNLISRHNIKGIRRFSRESFQTQLSIPGMYYFRAINHGELVGGSLYLVQDDVVYFHLSAFTDLGYKTDAAYAVKWEAIRYFSGKYKIMNLGGSTSANEGHLSGLDQFKKGWSTGTAKSYYCGKVLDEAKYQLLTTSLPGNSGWFPAYRQGDY